MQVAEWVSGTAFSAQLASLFPIADSSKVRVGRLQQWVSLVRWAGVQHVGAEAPPPRHYPRLVAYPYYRFHAQRA